MFSTSSEAPWRAWEDILVADRLMFYSLVYVNDALSFVKGGKQECRAQRLYSVHSALLNFSGL